MQQPAQRDVWLDLRSADGRTLAAVSNTVKFQAKYASSAYLVSVSSSHFRSQLKPALHAVVHRQLRHRVQGAVDYVLFGQYLQGALLHQPVQ